MPSSIVNNTSQLFGTYFVRIIGFEERVEVPQSRSESFCIALLYAFEAYKLLTKEPAHDKTFSLLAVSSDERELIFSVK